MDTKELLLELRTVEKNHTTVLIENEQLKASNVTLTTERDGLRTQLDAANQSAPAVTAELTALKGEHDGVKAELAVADTALREICTKVLTASGQVGAEVPASLADVITKITETKVNLVAGGKATGAEGELEASAEPAVTSFRTRR